MKDVKILPAPESLKYCRKNFKDHIERMSFYRIAKKLWSMNSEDVYEDLGTTRKILFSVMTHED